MKRMRRKQLKILEHTVREKRRSVTPYLEELTKQDLGEKSERNKYMDSILDFLGEGQTTTSVLRQARESKLEIHGRQHHKMVT